MTTIKLHHVYLSALLLACTYASPQATAELDWTTEVVDPDTIDSDSWEAGATTICLDSAGNPWISYVNGPIGGETFDVKLAAFTGDEWTFDTVDSDTWGHASLALDSHDRPHLCFRQSNLYAQGILRYATWTGDAWAIETVDPTLGLYGPSITVDASDRPHIAYGSGAYPDWSLKYARWTGSEWDLQEVDAEGYQIREATSIALDSQGRAHISYTLCCVEGLRQVKYAHWDGSAWQIDAIALVDTPLSTSLALDSNDRPHIAYTMGATDGISFASKVGDEWESELITTARIWYARLALGSDDEPRIAYYHADDGALVFALRQAGEWTIQVVDDDPSPSIRIGRFPSIAVADDDSVHVSYYYHSQAEPNQLKYAYAPAACPGDLDGDGDTDQSDLGILLADWGCDDPVNGCAGDLNGDDKTDQADLGILLADWGCSASP